MNSEVHQVDDNQEKIPVETGGAVLDSYAEDIAGNSSLYDSTRVQQSSQSGLLESEEYNMRRSLQCGTEKISQVIQSAIVTLALDNEESLDPSNCQSTNQSVEDVVEKDRTSILEAEKANARKSLQKEFEKKSQSLKSVTESVALDNEKSFDRSNCQSEYQSVEAVAELDLLEAERQNVRSLQSEFVKQSQSIKPVTESVSSDDEKSFDRSNFRSENQSREAVSELHRINVPESEEQHMRRSLQSETEGKSHSIKSVTGSVALENEKSLNRSNRLPENQTVETITELARTNIQEGGKQHSQRSIQSEFEKKSQSIKSVTESVALDNEKSLNRSNFHSNIHSVESIVELDRTRIRDTKEQSMRKSLQNEFEKKSGAIKSFKESVALDSELNRSNFQSQNQLAEAVAEIDRTIVVEAEEENILRGLSGRSVAVDNEKQLDCESEKQCLKIIAESGRNLTLEDKEHNIGRSRRVSEKPLDRSNNGPEIHSAQNIGEANRTGVIELTEQNMQEHFSAREKPLDSSNNESQIPFEQTTVKPNQSIVLEGEEQNILRTLRSSEKPIDCSTTEIDTQSFKTITESGRSRVVEGEERNMRDSLLASEKLLHSSNNQSQIRYEQTTSKLNRAGVLKCEELDLRRSLSTSEKSLDRSDNETQTRSEKTITESDRSEVGEEQNMRKNLPVSQKVADSSNNASKIQFKQTTAELNRTRGLEDMAQNSRRSLATSEKPLNRSNNESEIQSKKLMDRLNSGLGNQSVGIVSGPDRDKLVDNVKQNTLRSVPAWKKPLDSLNFESRNQSTETLAEPDRTDIVDIQKRSFCSEKPVDGPNYDSANQSAKPIPEPNKMTILDDEQRSRIAREKPVDGLNSELINQLTKTITDTDKTSDLKTGEQIKFPAAELHSIESVALHYEKVVDHRMESPCGKTTEPESLENRTENNVEITMSYSKSAKSTIARKSTVLENKESNKQKQLTDSELENNPQLVNTANKEKNLQSIKNRFLENKGQCFQKSFSDEDSNSDFKNDSDKTSTESITSENKEEPHSEKAPEDSKRANQSITNHSSKKITERRSLKSPLKLTTNLRDLDNKNEHIESVSSSYSNMGSESNIFSKVIADSKRKSLQSLKSFTEAEGEDQSIDDGLDDTNCELEKSPHLETETRFFDNILQPIDTAAESNSLSRQVQNIRLNCSEKTTQTSESAMQILLLDNKDQNGVDSNSNGKPSPVLTYDKICQTVEEPIPENENLKTKTSDMLNQIDEYQKTNAALELEIKRKEDLIIKLQTEAIDKEQNHKKEMKDLRAKFKQNPKFIYKDSTEILEQKLQDAKEREAKATAELNQKTKDALKYEKLMEQFQDTIEKRFKDYLQLHEEHEVTKEHLSNLEAAFSDVHSKYEKTKAILLGMKRNEAALQETLREVIEDNAHLSDKLKALRFESEALTNKYNEEMHHLQKQTEENIRNQKTLVKRVQIQYKSLEAALNQKNEECKQLSVLCEEAIGKKI